MTRIRCIQIENFRAIESLEWFPSSGLNCLIGPGDSGKTTIIDAIDYCLGARRNLQINDADFFQMDTSQPISITITIGELGDSLKSMESYGPYLRGYLDLSDTIEDEPGAHLETVLSVNLTVTEDLEPIWSLVSDRATASGLSRNLSWGDRGQVAPTRLGDAVEQNLAWKRGSVLSRLSDDKAKTGPALAKVARDARSAFGDTADAQLTETLKIATEVSADLGISVGKKVRALLDPQSISVNGGTVSLHSASGIPLQGLGLGSTRLLVAGLQRRAADAARIVLIDELEHGLEPHRIIRLLNSLGSKDSSRPLQVFMTTHSPTALRELNGNQLFVVRSNIDGHKAMQVGNTDSAQGTIRATPEAFLALSVFICEGASEVGLMRGLDQHRVETGKLSLNALAVALVDAKGVSQIYNRANAFTKLEYRTAVLRDDDAQPKANDEKAFTDEGGALFVWRKGRKLEDEIFTSLTDEAIAKLIAYAVELHGDATIDANIVSASSNALKLTTCVAPFDGATRKILAKASTFDKTAWFKTVSWMEEVARQIIGPDLKKCDAGFAAIIKSIFTWVENDA